MSATIELKPLTNIIGRLTFEYPTLPDHIAQDIALCAAQYASEYANLLFEVELGSELQKNVDTYDFSHLMPDQLRLAKFKSVDFCGCCIFPVDPKCNPCANGYEVVNHHCIKLHPTPNIIDKNSNLTICMCVEPTDDACDVPSVLVERHWKALRNFARAELAMMKHGDWYDPNYARQQREAAMGMMRRIRSSEQKGFQEGARIFTGERWA